MISSFFLERLYKSSQIMAPPVPPPDFVRLGEAPAGKSFSETMSEVSDAAFGSLTRAEETAMSGMAGKADPHAIVEALAAVELALETAVLYGIRLLKPIRKSCGCLCKTHSASRVMNTRDAHALRLRTLFPIPEIPMNEAVIFDMTREALWIGLLIGAPLLGTALVVGLIIGLFQALTSIQEMTLTFVTKIGAMLIVFWMSMGFMSFTLIAFFRDRIIPLVSGAA